MSAATQEGLSHREDFERQHQLTVRQEIETFRQRAQQFLDGEITEDQFRPFRLKHGIYGQRQPGVQMVRCKIPGGLLTAPQLEQLGRIADEFGGGKGHLTTRQNIQYHFVPLVRVPDLMHMLADAGLTNREACYNTVRNVTTCTKAGIAHDEVFDVRPYAQRVAYALLRKDLTSNLPRKFKIAFDGCAGSDCVMGPMNDIGLKAVIREGKRGFRMVIGGGLGPLPMEAQLFRDFIPEERLLNWCEAIIRMFNKFGNRKNKNMARMKFVLRDRGFAWVKEQIEKEFADILKNGGIAWPERVPEGFGAYQSQPQPLGNGALLPVVNAHSSGHAAYDAWLASNVEEQRQTGYAAVTIRVDQGNLTSDQLRGVAQLAATAGDGLVRVAINQNLLLAFVPLARLRRVYAALQALDLAESGADQIADIITCPGAYSCNLALTKTMNLGDALQQTVRQYDDPRVKQLAIKASGCPNACGHHWIADIGFYGNARKVDGKEIPYYQMLLGGGFDEEGMLRFGLAVQSIPARLAPAAVERVLDHFIAHHLPGESFRQYVLRYKVETFRELTNEFANGATKKPSR
ncbi:Nitrite/sulfite reductase, hemoprotein beta-component, ferrodoxin domain protein [Candidatus Sulfopaludibacter sp. SbA3]|nr:Nitrite/sulfite reductase, hemoprotein beta-component, ferrodoxin domain protein [Candidatus Sulfopaludibacter sp. SbA3]